MIKAMYASHCCRTIAVRGSRSHCTRISTTPVDRISRIPHTRTRIQFQQQTKASTGDHSDTMSSPWVLIGSGRVGSAFADMGSGSDVMIQRGEAIAGPEGPIVICTRNDDLEGIVKATPPERREDLVFIQNGMLQPWLDDQGLGDNTQVLVYFAVASKGEAPTDGKTDTNPEGLTAAYGKHAKEIALRLHNAGLSCHVFEKKEDFMSSMLEKLVWICSFMVVGAEHGCTVGEVEAQHREEVGQLIKELYVAGCDDLGIGGSEDIDSVVERLCAYARSVAHFPTAVKEFSWRNGYFYGLTEAAARDGRPDPCPFHTSLLQKVYF